MARCHKCWSLESHVVVPVSSLPAYYPSRRRPALLPLGRSGNLWGVLPFLHLLLCFVPPCVCWAVLSTYIHTQTHFAEEKKRMDLPSEMRKKGKVCVSWKFPRGWKEIIFILSCLYTCLNIISRPMRCRLNKSVHFSYIFSIASLSHTVFKQGVSFWWGLFFMGGADDRSLRAVFLYECPFPSSVINTRAKSIFSGRRHFGEPNL